jgi:hypothetical protein
MIKPEILYEKIWYLNTYLKSKTDESGSLITHLYVIKKTPKGYFKLDNKLDVQTFSTDEELAQYIERHDARELPDEADGNPKFVPQEVQDLMAAFKKVGRNAAGWSS